MAMRKGGGRWAGDEGVVWDVELGGFFLTEFMRKTAGVGDVDSVMKVIVYNAGRFAEGQKCPSSDGAWTFLSKKKSFAIIIIRLRGLVLK